jgi:hypothetical protein
VSEPGNSGRPPEERLDDVEEGRQRSLAEHISPDDWRLYHVMRELPQVDRARVIAFAELLFNLRLARARVERR